MLGHTEKADGVDLKPGLGRKTELQYTFTEDTIIDQNTLSHCVSDTTERNGIGAS